VSSLPGVSRRVLQYLSKISEGGGSASRMDFLRVAGNEANLNDWIGYLVRCNLIGVESSADGKTSYVLTDLGRKMFELLKDYQFLGPLFGDLSRNRRRRE